MDINNSVYWSLVSITREYLGPASERFIDRQISNHLNKEPGDITKKDITTLVDWLQGSVSLLTDNERMVEDYINKLRELSHTQSIQRVRKN